MRSFLSVILLALTLSATCQKVDKLPPPPQKQIETRGDTLPGNGAYFIGELHDIYEGQKFEFDLIRMLYRKYGITDIAKEMGKSDAYLFNAYFKYGDSTLLNYYGRSEAVMELLQQWQDLYNDCNFTLHGIDFERSSFAPAILSILQKSQKAINTPLYRYLADAQKREPKEGGKSGRKIRIALYNEARSIFRHDSEELKGQLVTGYDIIADILENPTTEKGMEDRDVTMAENLLRLKQCRFVCIVGVGHTTLHKNSLLKRFIADSSCPRKTSLISMVCRNCYSTSYYGTELTPMFSDYEEKNTAYMTTAFDSFYKPGYYSLVNQNEFINLPGGYNKIPTYYVLFKDQPKR